MDYDMIWQVAKILGIVLLVFLVVGGIILYYFWKRSAGKKYDFLLYSSDAKTITIVKADVSVNPENVNDKLFTFANNTSKLEIRKPSRFIDGKPYREITFDNEGKYCYLTQTSFDEKKLEMSLQPEEKQIALFRLKESQERYKNPMEKLTAITLIAGFIMCLIIIGGVLFCTIKFSSQIGTIAEIAKDNKAVSEMNGQTMNKMVLITEQLAAISGTKMNTNSSDLVRQLS
jgi:uncharacterized membrane protein YciS (DUF1049 family)